MNGQSFLQFNMVSMIVLIFFPMFSLVIFLVSYAAFVSFITGPLGSQLMGFLCPTYKQVHTVI